MTPIPNAAELPSFIAEADPPLLLIGAVLLSLLPIALLCTTSFLKLSIVFGILRNALGAQQIPSSSLTSALCFILTLHIMMPTYQEIRAAVTREFRAESEPTSQSTVSPAVSPQSPSKSPSHETGTPPPQGATPPEHRATSFPGGQAKRLDIHLFFRVAGVAIEPLERFLRRHAAPNERVYFATQSLGEGEGSRAREHDEAEVSRNLANPNGPIPGESILSLIPAFMITEIRAAFTIGFFLFLPFLVVDLIVAIVLSALGMNMVSPMAIALPLKIALFIGSDAWFVLCKALITHYQ